MRWRSVRTEAWSRILGIGKNWNQLSRVRNNMTSKDSPLAPVYTLRKDHKAYLSAVECPLVRPVCGVDSSGNEKLSWLLSTLFSKLWEDDRGGSVCLDIDFTIEKVCETFARSTFSVEGVDYKHLSLYLALNMTKVRD